MPEPISPDKARQAIALLRQSAELHAQTIETLDKLARSIAHHAGLPAPHIIPQRMTSRTPRSRPCPT